MWRFVQRLRRALAIEPGESALVAWSAITLFLIEWASVAVSNASDTLFLKRVGIDYVPVVFLANSLLLTATTLGAGALAVRFDLRRLLTATFFVLAMVLLVLWVLVVLSAPGIATTLVIVSKQIDVIAALLFWTVVGGLMTSRQGKRLVGLMTAGGTLGTILGSFTSGTFGQLFGIPGLLGIAAAFFAVAALATIPLGASAQLRLYRRGRRVMPEQEQRPRFRSFWGDSSLFRVLVVTSFLAGALGPMLYFEFSYAADLATRTADGEQKLLALYGELRGWINVGVLVLQVGASAALFRHVGVPLAATLAPAAYLAGLTGLSIRFGLPTAMPATMGTSVLDHTIYEPAQRVLAALLPPRMRVPATSVIQGPAKRAGAALGSVLILAVLALVDDPATVALVGIPIAGLWFALALMLWRDYPNLLLEAASVRRTDTDPNETRAALLDPGTLRILQQNLEGREFGPCRAACELFADAAPAVAIEALTRAMARAPAQNRPLLLDTLDQVMAGLATPAAAGSTTRAGLPGGAARTYVASGVAANIMRVLSNASSELLPFERAKLLHVLGRASSGRAVPKGIRELLESSAAGETGCARFAAQAACMRTGIGDASPERFDQDVGAALDSPDPYTRATALAELRFELIGGDDRDERWKRRLSILIEHVAHTACPQVNEDRPVAGLKADDDSARRALSARGCAEAVEALADVALVHRDAVAAHASAVLALADDEDPYVRSAVLRFVGSAAMSSHARLLSERLSSRNAFEAAAARTALEMLGPAAADALLHALRNGRRRARESLPEMLRDLRVDHAALRLVIDREIERSYELLIILGVLDASVISRLVLQRLRERVDESLRVSLELVAVILDDDRVANVCRSLGRAWNVRDRAVLLEALEALLPPAEGARILPLLEDQGAQRLAAAAAQALDRKLPTLEEALQLALATRDALTTALLAATVDRPLLASVAPELDVEAALRIFSQVRRAAPASPATEERPAGGAAPSGAGAGIAPAPDNEEPVMLSQVETMLHLRALDLFEGLTTRQLAELARVVREMKMPRGTVIVAEGDFDDRMYFIVSGNVRISKAGQEIADIGPRDFFGEMAVFDGETRSATATAATEVRLLRLSRDDLFEVMEDQPAIGIGICQTLVRRLRNLLNERSTPPSQ